MNVSRFIRGASAWACLSLASCGLLSTSLLECHAPPPILKPVQDPTAGEIRLGTHGGFDAYLVHKSDVGVWTIKCLPIFERYGCCEIVALDDRGSCTILSSYSGKWTPWVAVQDGMWLGAVAHDDVDPRRPGKELYVGGKRGNLYQVWPYPQGGFDANVIAYLPGKQIHTIVAGDFDRPRAGIELIAFTDPGGIYLIEPTDSPAGSFTCSLLEELPGRVRDAAVLKTSGGEILGVADVSNAGQVGMVRMEAGKLKWTTLYQTDMGLGRLAVKPRAEGEPIVLYATTDDGRVLRFEQRHDGSFQSEVNTPVRRDRAA